MRQGIVIGAYHGNAEPLDLLLKSLQDVHWPVLVVVSGATGAPADWLNNLGRFVQLTMGWDILFNSDDRYELGAFARVMDSTDLDEFLFLQDSFEVIDQNFIDAVMAHDGPVALGPAMFHYAGKWRREILAQMTIPEVHSKRESVHYEHTFSRQYLEHETKPLWTFDHHFHDGEHQGFVEAFGRTNMLLENDFYRKRKADWGQRPL